MSRFFSWAMERPRKWTSTNPARKEKSRRTGTELPPSILTLDQCKAILDAAAAHRNGVLAPYVAVCLFGGLRPFEAARLTWKQVNLTDGEIRLEAWQTKTNRPRVVAIDQTLGAWLKAYEGVPFHPKNWRRHFDFVRALAGFGNPERFRTKTRKRFPAELKPWPDDVMRHTAISHYFRKSGSYGRTAEQFGNSEAIIKAHYQARVSTEETAKFYAMLPPSKRRAAEPPRSKPTREKLYGLVWSKPTVDVAADLGISNVSVAKLVQKAERPQTGTRLLGQTEIRPETGTDSAAAEVKPHIETPPPAPAHGS